MLLYRPIFDGTWWANNQAQIYETETYTLHSSNSKTECHLTNIKTSDNRINENTVYINVVHIILWGKLGFVTVTDSERF